MKIGRSLPAAASEARSPPARVQRPVLEIRLLGELQVVRDGTPIALPPSKKTRALLGYLVASGRAHLRERLCELLWEGPGDPRAELRWSLTKLRPLVNDAAAERLHGGRERVVFDACGAEVDLVRARALLAPGVDALAVETLFAAARLLEGELLDGLDLPACPRFHEWCVAEREAVSALRVATLKALLLRVANQPEDALALSRKWVAADPLAEPAHAAVVRQLGALGRARDALAHYQHARRLLETELAAPLTGELDEARRAVQSAQAAAIAAAMPGTNSVALGTPHTGSSMSPPPPPAPAAVPVTSASLAEARPAFASERLIGRARERERIEQQLVACVRQPGAATPFLLFAGEPGIGKSRLLEHLRERAIAAGGSVAAARAFEAEVARPYGIWVDALRGVDKTDVPSALREDLATLLPELAGAGRNDSAAAINAPAQASDRLRLFDAVVALLRHAAARQRLAVLLLDDLQWADDASCALLHYVDRALRARAGRAGVPDASGRTGHVLIAGAARTHELEENAAVRNLLASLAREQQLLRFDLDPLSASETAELVKTVAPALDAAAIFAASDGNPLFTRELAQARAQGIDWSAGSLGSLLRAQLIRLDMPIRELLTYAAAFGRSFTVEVLGVACGFGAAALTSALGELERRGVLRAVDEARYDFTHDLVRQAAYGDVSQPRRRLLHAQIARALAVAAERDETLHAEVARHASLASDHELAVRACIAAGERALRSFAGTEAATLAEMGLRHLQSLPATRDKLRMHVGLLSVKVTAHTVLRGLRHPPAILDQLLQAVAAAQAAGLHAEAAHGYHLVAVLYQDAGNHTLAQQSTLRAEHAGRAADDMTRVRHLALTAQCLIDLERDVERARALLHEATLAAAPLGLELADLRYATGLLARWDGDVPGAIANIERALQLAQQRQDGWLECRCVEFLAMLEHERANTARVLDHAARLIAIGNEMGAAEVPFARVLRALAASGAGAMTERAELFDALRALRDASDKSLLAYAMNQAALHFAARGDMAAARALALEALAAAEAVQRPTEALIAHALLLRAAAAQGERRAADATFERLRADEAGAMSARARAAITAAAHAAGFQFKRE